MNFCVDCPPNDTHCYGVWQCVWSAITTVWTTAWAFFEWGQLVATVAKRDYDGDELIHLYSHGPMSLYYNTSLTNYAKRDNVHNVQDMTVQLNGVNMYSVDASWTDLSVTLELNHHPDLVARATQNATNGMSTNGRRDYTDYNHAYSSGGGIKYNYCAVHPEHDLTERYDWDGIWAAAAQNGPNLANYYYSDVGVVDMNDSVNGGWRTLIGTGKMIEEQSTSFGNDFEGCDYDVFSQLAR